MCEERERGKQLKKSKQTSRMVSGKSGVGFWKWGLKMEVEEFELEGFGSKGYNFEEG